jgi:hypothetical protein
MKLLYVKLKSVAPYSQSKFYEKEMEQGESADDHYRRTWRNHLHVDKDGVVVMPANGLKNCLSEAAKFLSIGVPGKGKATYTKNFEAGVLVVKNPSLGIKKEDVEYEALFLPSDGKRGGSKRVMKYYPVIPEWQTEVEYVVVDETVLQTSMKDKNKTVFQEVLEGAGQYIGLGRWRPRNNGIYGRFDVVSIQQT